MNVKLVNLLLDDVYKTLKNHLIGFEVYWSLIQGGGTVGYFQIKKKVPFLWWWTRMKNIGEIRYSVSAPYMVFDMWDEADYHALSGNLKNMEADLKRRGFLTRYNEIDVNIGVKR